MKLEDKVKNLETMILKMKKRLEKQGEVISMLCSHIEDLQEDIEVMQPPVIKGKED